MAIFMPVLLFFTAFEVFLRVFRSPINIKEITGRTVEKVQSPMAKWALIDAFSAYRGKSGKYAKDKTVNRHGFISTPDLAVSKPSNTLRIVYLGGSSTAGTGINLEDKETWPWKTTQLLQKKTEKKIEFINAALGGYTSFESYGRLWSRIRHFSPDIIVVYHGWNEMHYFSRIDLIHSWRSLPDGSWSFEREPVKLFESHWIDHLISWSQLLTRIRLKLSKQISGELPPHCPKSLSSTFDRRGLDVFRINLKLIKSFAEIIDARIFVAKQATLISPNLPDSERKRCRYKIHCFDYDSHIDAFQNIYRVIDQEIPAQSIIDVTEISGCPEYFYDHIHPTPEGTSQIARIVSESLLPHLEFGHCDP